MCASIEAWIALKYEALKMQIYASSVWGHQQSKNPEYCEFHLGVNYLISMIHPLSQIKYLHLNSISSILDS